MALHTVHAACPHDCPDTCAIRVTVDDGRVVRLQGDPDHAPTNGVLCTKVSRYAERTHHPERLLHPLKRVGPKGSGRFERVGWSEAVADIAARLKNIATRDPQGIVPYSYAGTMGMLQGEAMAARSFNRLGASQLDRTICSSAGGEALGATYGGEVGMHVEFFAESRLIVIWGSNPITSSVHFWNLAQQAKRAGAKLWCIDPRRNDTADKCHRHLALRPGTDGALALAVMHELVVNGWLDEDYIARHVSGFEALRERAMQWPPQRAAAVCGVDAEAIRELACDYGCTQPAAIRLNYGMQRVRGGGNAVRLIALLRRPEQLAGRTPRRINMSRIGDALLNAVPPIEALIVYNSNPLAVAPDSAKVAQGFARENLFTVVLEQFMTDSADFADYVLPATMQLEHLDVHTTYGHTDVMINEPAVAPMGQAKPNTLPLPEAPFAQGGFFTADGRAPVDVPGLGVPDYVPNHESAESSPELAARYPLAMISPPARHFMNSSFVNVTSLRAIEGEPLVEIHPLDAAARGIAHGAMVRVFNDRGSFRCRADVSDRARPGVVNGLGIWWRKLGADGRNVNELTSQQLTDIGRAAVFYDCLVDVAVND